MTLARSINKSENKWIETIEKHLKDIAKRHEGIKTVLDYIKNNKKSFNTVKFYQDFNKKQTQLVAKEKVHQSDKAEPAVSRQSLLNEDDIFNLRILNDDRSSIVSTDSNQFEEVKTIGMKDSLVHDKMKEYQVHKGKVTSTYIMKAGAGEDDSFSYFGSVNGDADLSNSVDKRMLIISRIIKHQLNQETHPIRMIIHQFSI